MGRHRIGLVGAQALSLAAGVLVSCITLGGVIMAGKPKNSRSNEAGEASSDVQRRRGLRCINDHDHSILAMISIRAIEPFGIGVIERHRESLLL